MRKLIHPWQKKPVYKRLIFSASFPMWTLVMPVYNQQNKLRNVLDKLIKNSSLPFDIILINDGSDDNSLKIIKEFLKYLTSKKIPKVCRFELINNSVPIYETACDNQGFKRARTEYIIEVQADIHVEEYAFDKKMIHAMNKFNLGAVSGRHVHNFSLIENWKLAIFKYPLSLIRWRILKSSNPPEFSGLIGQKIFSRSNESENVCFIGETVARGPWLVRKSDLEKLSYLNEDHFFLGNDDHDYHRRLFLNLKKFVGYVPLDIFSIMTDGSQRKERKGLNAKIFNFLRETKKGSSEFNLFIRRYRPYQVIKKFIL